MKYLVAFLVVICAGCAHTKDPQTSVQHRKHAPAIRTASLLDQKYQTSEFRKMQTAYPFLPSNAPGTTCRKSGVTSACNVP